MTAYYAQVLDEEGLLRVAALKGRAWRCFGSPGMTDWLTDITAFFCTDGPAITVFGIAEYLDFEGVEDTYSLLHVDDGAPDFDEAENEELSIPVDRGVFRRPPFRPVDPRLRAVSVG